jgi:hypothetical protein
VRLSRVDPGEFEKRMAKKVGAGDTAPPAGTVLPKSVSRPPRRGGFVGGWK